MTRRRSFVGVVLCNVAILPTVVGAFHCAAHAQGIIEVIALSGDAPPDGNGTFLNFRAPALNNAGQTAFLAALTGTTGGTIDDSGIYRGEASTGSLRQIARENPAGPIDSGLTDLLASPALNDAGEAAFLATFLQSTIAGGGSFNTVYRGSGGALTIIAREGGAAPDGNGDFLGFFTPALNASGQAAFLANLTGTSGGENCGIFRGSGGAVTQIAREGAAAPDGNGDFSGFFGTLALNASGQVAFYTTLTGTSGGSSDNTGIFLGAGGAVTQIARENPAGPLDSGLTSLDFSALNDAGEAAFLALFLQSTVAGGGSLTTIYRGSGGALTTIAQEGFAAPDGNGDFLRFGSPALNASGQAAFEAFFTGTSGGASDNSGIFLGSGGAVTQIARAGAAAPDGNGDFSNFGTLALNASGQVAFFADFTGTSGGSSDDGGIFLANGIDTIQVAREGETLAGGTIASLLMENSVGDNGDERSGINDDGQVAFRATLDNGDQAIVRFTIPDVHWTAPASGSWNANTNWVDGIKPNSFYDTFVDPASDVQVLGPAGIFHAKSLILGGGGGQAALSLQAGSLLGILDGPLVVASGGTLTGSGIVDAGLNNQAGGEVLASAGNTLTFTGIGSDNFGRVTMTGGTLHFTRDFTNQPGGLVIGNGTLRTGTGLTNHGTMAFSATTNVVGDVTNLASGLVATAGGLTTFLDDVDNQGEVRTSAGSHTVFFGSLSGGGSFTGTGTVVMESDFTPGASTATIDFGGDVVFGPAAALEIEIGSSILGVEFDMLDIAGDVSLAGTLDVSLLGFGFSPSFGDMFEIITAASVVDTFDVEMLPDLDGLNWNVLYSATNVVLEVVADVDFDNDGDVDGRDFLLIQRNDPSLIPQWESQYGSGVPPLATSQAVPEPCSLLLGTLAILLCNRPDLLQTFHQEGVVP